MSTLSSFVNRLPEGRNADVEAWEENPTAANLATALSPNTTGTGNVVFADSPTLTGTPTAPTASPGTNTTQIATTAFVQGELSSSTFLEFLVFSVDGSLTTGTGQVTFYMPFAATLESVKASVGTAPTGANLIIDINESGTTVLSTKLSIDAGEKTSATAASPAIISDSSIAADTEVTIDIDQVGSTVAGSDLKVYLEVTRA